MVAVWEEHMKYEFADKDVSKTMKTMTDNVRPCLLTVYKKFATNTVLIYFFS